MWILAGLRDLTLADVPFRSIAVAALTCLAVAACAGGPTTQTINNPIPAPSQTQLTGTTLESALLPVSNFPAGYTVDTQESTNSGSALLSGSSASASPPRGCLQMVETVKSPTAGITASVFEVLDNAAASNISGYHQSQYGMAVIQFATESGSTSYFDLIRSTFTRCSSMTTVMGGTKTVIRQSVRPASPVARQQALLVQQTGTVNGVAAESVELYTMDKTDVYLMGQTVFSAALTAQPASLAAWTTKLIARVRMYECALAC